MSNLLVVLFLASAFLIGFLANYAVNYAYLESEFPFSTDYSNWAEQPGNWISANRIEVLKDKVVIHVSDVSLSRYAATGSMLPVLGENANGLRIKPTNPEQVQVGDIVSYESNGDLIVHRVIRKGEDENGVWFITKGDNNSISDGKIYFENIRHVTVGLIY